MVQYTNNGLIPKSSFNNLVCIMSRTIICLKQKMPAGWQAFSCLFSGIDKGKSLKKLLEFRLPSFGVFSAPEFHSVFIFYSPVFGIYFE